jgi:hypothetical protein
MNRIATAISLFSISVAMGQNPIVPPGVYIADPSARVFSDGKLRIYGSLDESTQYYCSHRHHTLETADMKRWKITENIFASKGEGDAVSYSDTPLSAPDCMEKDGKYFLYYCMAQPKDVEGVATSSSPTGPFTDGRPLDVGGFEQIDPSVFIDDDGQAYYLWGQFEAKMAKLKPDMTEIDPATIVNGVVNEKEHHFHEGAFMFKRNGIYYLVYADVSRANRPTCIGYSTAKSPFGPYKYGGVIVDNDRCDPSNWNNHGSVAKFKENWYVFYHRATHNSFTMRKACVEPITFQPDGSIREVEMTSQGASPSLDAFRDIDAARACLLFGNVHIARDGTNNEILTGIRNNDNVAFKYLDFGKGAKKVRLRVKALGGGGEISIHAGQPWTLAIGKVAVPETKGGDWQTITGDIKKTEGIHAVWLSFQGTNPQMYEIDSLSFGK